MLTNPQYPHHPIHRPVHHTDNAPLPVLLQHNHEIRAGAGRVPRLGHLSHDLLRTGVAYSFATPLRPEYTVNASRISDVTSTPAPLTRRKSSIRCTRFGARRQSRNFASLASSTSKCSAARSSGFGRAVSLLPKHWQNQPSCCRTKGEQISDSPWNVCQKLFP